MVNGFIVTPGSTRKVKFEHLGFNSSTIQRLLQDNVYRKIVDFDEHLNEDVSLDWSNQEFADCVK